MAAGCSCGSVPERGSRRSSAAMAGSAATTAMPGSVTRRDIRPRSTAGDCHRVTAHRDGFMHAKESRSRSSDPSLGASPTRSLMCLLACVRPLTHEDYCRNAAMTSRALSTPMDGHKMGRSRPAFSYSDVRSQRGVLSDQPYAKRRQSGARRVLPPASATDQALGWPR